MAVLIPVTMGYILLLPDAASHHDYWGYWLGAHRARRGPYQISRASEPSGLVGRS